MNTLKKIIRLALFAVSIPLFIYIWEAMFVLQIAIIWPLKVLPLFLFTALAIFFLFKKQELRRRLTFASIVGVFAFASALGFELVKVNPYFADQKIESESFKNLQPIKLEKSFMNRMVFAQTELSKTPIFSFFRNDSVLYVMKSYTDMQYVLSYAPFLTKDKINETCQAFQQYENLSYCLPRLAEEIGQHQDLTASGKVLLMTTIATGIFNLQESYKALLKDEDAQLAILKMRFVNDFSRLNKQIMMDAAIPLKNQNTLTKWVEEEIKHKYVSIALKKMNAMCDSVLSKVGNKTFDKSKIASRELKELKIHSQDYIALTERFFVAYDQTRSEDQLYQLFVLYKDDFLMKIALWFRKEFVIE